LFFYDTNNNGIQDTGESGVPDIQVRLYQGDPSTQTPALDTTTTDANGKYIFLDVPANGMYYVQMDQVGSGQPNSILLTNYAPSKPNQGTDKTKDSNGILRTTGTALYVTSDVFPVNRNNVLDIDYGFVQKVPFTNTIFKDTNGDGIKDPAEDPGLANVNVYLFDPVNNITLGPTQTDSNGQFTFTGVPGNTYEIRVPVTNNPSLTGLIPTVMPSNPNAIVNSGATDGPS